MASFRTCPDGHMCENGSSCVQNPLQEGTYYCDCGTAASGTYAGLFCEYGAETYCQLPQETSSTWFCTNGGTCVLAASSVASSSGGSGQWTCDCPNGDYEGPVSFESIGGERGFGGILQWEPLCKEGMVGQEWIAH
jgi:hypothetical protein